MVVLQNYITLQTFFRAAKNKKRERGSGDKFLIFYARFNDHCLATIIVGQVDETDGRI